MGYVLWDRRSSIYNSPCVGACVHGRQARPGRSTRAGGRAMIKALGVVRHREAARGPCCRVGVAHARASSSSMDRSPWCGRCDAMIARTMHACILYCARQQLAQVRGADPNSNARSRTSWWPGRGRGQVTRSRARPRTGRSRKRRAWHHRRTSTWDGDWFGRSRPCANHLLPVACVAVPGSCTYVFRPAGRPVLHAEATTARHDRAADWQPQNGRSVVRASGPGRHCLLYVADAGTTS